MKRNSTFELRRVYPDYNIRMPKELEKRIGLSFKLLGNIRIGEKLEIHFEDGLVFKTSALQIEGYINERDVEGNLKRVTMITKDMGYEFVLSEKDIKINIYHRIINYSLLISISEYNLIIRKIFKGLFFYEL